MSDASPLLSTGRFQPKQIAGQVYGSCSGYGAMRVAGVDAEGFELTRAGRRFSVGINAAVTGIAPVQAIPTTAAQWTIFNTSATDSLTFEQLGMMLASGTAGAGITVWAAYFTLPVQTGLASGVAVPNQNGGTNKVSAAAIKSGVTITTPAAPSWFPVAKSDSANTAVLSVAAVNTDVKGRLILPPQTGLALATLSPAGSSPLYIPFASWTEGAQDLE